MKNIAIVLMMSSMLAASCNKFLDVTPRDLILEDQVYSTEAGMTNALNGVYLGMTSDALYGGSLTLSTVEVMAQRFDLTTFGHSWKETGVFNYNNANVKFLFNNTWTEGYKNILNLNVFLQKVRNTNGVVSAANKDLLMGEAFGLRAMIHFDLLRLFGPVYATNSSAVAIPYYTAPSPVGSQPLAANTVLQNVLNDLDSAATLLKNDPLITAGPMQVSATDGNTFYRYRNVHLNYYAVKALQARVHLYAGHKAEAYTLATGVITDATKWFPWSIPTTVDAVFSSEVLFGPQNLDLYLQQNRYYASTLSAATILAPGDTRLSASFDGNLNDYRFKAWWKRPTSGGKTFYTFFKYDDPGNTTELNIARYMQPLIRLTEMYYIAAETETDPVKALVWLNKVRFNRGLADLPPTADLPKSIRSEYVREFFGEGQLFFYYKRTNAASIPNSTAPAGNRDMTDAQYVVPLPLSETQIR
ncbi:RagB/SusD family nutrient uptake outer membrane protein [Chitinophaga arvensicola]|uniref:SusD family protein n=1 Tax=Chitinophaga arvensicola TaxID=29529 RepID=A0A1I0RQA6_9BACT|nr:RagB/SusD family nutrient uptake outer membrane protein [Chitinophaga arvensicola]SEW43501.1 SusD family protein [Chitinophaga arvensicola]